MNRNSKPLLKKALLHGFAAIWLAGCASGSAPTIYDLVAPVETGVGGSQSMAQLLVPLPRAIRALNTSNIAVLSSGNTISYFTKASWSDDLPNLVQAKLVETLENTGRTSAVGTPRERLLTDFRISTEIRAFQLETAGKRRAVVAIVAKVINEKDGKVVGSKLFKSEISVGSTETDEAVSALNDAANAVLVEIAGWTLKQVW